MAAETPGQTIARDSVPDSRAISADEVLAALDCILASDAFARVERPSNFLRHLVETTLNGEPTRLKETLLGIEVFGREPSWNTRVDPVVRQEASRLRKRLARYYASASPAVRVELPVGTYVPVFRRVGGEMPQAEASAENTHENTFIEPKPAATPVLWRRVWLPAAVGLLLAAALAGAWRFSPMASAATSPSIVVLPFTDLGAGNADGYFVDGLTDEITDELVRLKGLRVIARTSARVFKGKNADVREVGRQFNVSHVLEGSVERSGDQVRISAHLERTSDGMHVWSQTYDRPVEDVFAVQSELASAIARNLQVESGTPAVSPHVPGQEAHELLLRADFEMQNGTPEAIARGEQDLRKAVQIDPGYAKAWLLLGVAALYLPAASGRNATSAETAEARNLYRRAISLDPDLPLAHAHLAQMAVVDWDWATAERELRLAARNGPDPVAEFTHGLMLSDRGQFREADRHMELARALDPTGPDPLSGLATIRYWEGRYPEAIALSRQILDRYPDQPTPQVVLALTYIRTGKADLALATLRRLEVRYPPMRLLEVMALGCSGRREEGLRLVRQMETKYGSDQGVYRHWFALAWASVGDHARALQWLERSADLHEFPVVSLAVSPAFAEMRDEPGFRALVKRIGVM